MAEDPLKEAEDSQDKFTDKFKENLDLLRDAIVSLGDRLNSALIKGIENTNSLGDATKRVANRYRRELETSIDKVIIGTDTLKELQSKVNKGLDVTTDITREINRLEQDKEKILSRVASLKRQGIDLEEETATLLKYHLADQENLLKNLQKENKNREDSLGILGKFAEGTQGVLEHVDKSGKFSKALGLDEAIKKTRSFATDLTNSGKQTAGMGQQFKIAGNLAGNIGKNLLKGLGPIAIIATIVHELFETIVEIDKVVGDTAKKLGLSYDQAFEIKGEMADIANSSLDIFATSENILHSFNSINEALGTRARINKEDLLTYNDLLKKVGYTEEAATGLYKLSVLGAKPLKQQTEEIQGQIGYLQSKNHLSLNYKKITEDITKTSSNLQLTLRGSGTALATAVVKARELGASLEQVEGTASSLLDFESSIEAQMSYQVISGKRLNLDRARYAALTNDVATLSEELKKNIGTAEDWGKMNFIERQDLSKALGLSTEAIADMLVQQKMLESTKYKDIGDAQARWNELIAEGLTLDQARAKFGEGELANQMASVTMQEEFNQSIAKLKEVFVTIAKPLMAIIKPIVDILAPTLSVIGKILQAVIKPTIYAIKNTFHLIGEIVSPFVDLFHEIGDLLVDAFGAEDLKSFMGGLKDIGKAVYEYLLRPIGFIGKALVKFIIEPVKLIVHTFKGLVKIIKGDFVGGFKEIGDSITSFLISPFQIVQDLVVDLINSFGKLHNGIVDLIPKEVFEFFGGKKEDVMLKKLKSPDLAKMMSPKKESKIGDDVVSPGYGKRILSTPEGSIHLNNKDTVVAGTNLVPKSKTIAKTVSKPVKLVEKIVPNVKSKSLTQIVKADNKLSEKNIVLKLSKLASEVKVKKEEVKSKSNKGYISEDMKQPSIQDKENKIEEKPKTIKEKEVTNNLEINNSLNQIKEILTKILDKKGDVTLDGVKVGTILTNGNASFSL